MTARRLEFWFDFASTYSYVGAERIEGLCRAAGLTFEWRPFLLGPIFKQRGLETSPFNVQPARGAHMWRDVERLCSKYGLPWQRPSLFPQRSILAGRLAWSLLEHPSCGAFIRATFRAEFGAGYDIGQVATMERVLGSLGLDPAEWLKRAESPEAKAGLRAFSDEAVRRNIFGAPNLFVGDELFFGQDRLDDGLEWARTH